MSEKKTVPKKTVPDASKKKEAEKKSDLTVLKNPAAPVRSLIQDHMFNGPHESLPPHLL